MSGWGGGGQDGCERRIEVFVKIQKKNWGGGGQDGCERRIEVFVKIQKKYIFFFLGGGSGGCRVGGVWFGGVRVDVNEELKFLGKLKKKNGGSGGWVGGLSGRAGGGGTGLGGQRGCE